PSSTRADPGPRCPAEPPTVGHRSPGRALDLYHLTSQPKVGMMTDEGLAPTRRRRRTPVDWIREGGLSTLLFALPLIVIFGVFSWLPIGRALLMSFQETDLVVASWVGLDNFRSVLADPNLPTALRNTG